MIKETLKKNLTKVTIIATLILTPMTFVSGETVSNTEPEQIKIEVNTPNEKELGAAYKKQLTVKNNVTKEVEEERRKERQRKMEAYIKTIVCDPYDVSKVSGLKEDDYDFLTDGTWWEGRGHILYMLETRYGVNAFFAMSVSTLESYFGTSDRAYDRNNFYGIETLRYFDGLYDNTDYFGNLIKNHYFNEGRKSARRISYKYCPPHHDMWADFMEANMMSLKEKTVNKMRRSVQ